MITTLPLEKVGWGRREIEGFKRTAGRGRWGHDHEQDQLVGGVHIDCNNVGAGIGQARQPLKKVGVGGKIP